MEITTLDKPADSRTYPLEWAYPPDDDRPAWKQPDSDPSGGYAEVHRAHDADGSAVDHEEVTSS